MAREDWTEAHDDTLQRAMISHVLAHRREIYGTPGLEGVSDHGCERINKKIQAFAKRIVGDEKRGAEIVKEELAKLKLRSATVNGGGQGGDKGKKRRRVKQECDEGDA